APAAPTAPPSREPRATLLPSLPPRLLDVKAAAAYLGGLSPYAVRQLVHRGDLRIVQLGESRGWRFDVHDLDALIDAAKARA
ncbi:MAG: helix-turn-helix domain-containing protein, partial [Burkholderiales bacterium]